MKQKLWLILILANLLIKIYANKVSKCKILGFRHLGYNCKSWKRITNQNINKYQEKWLNKVPNEIILIKPRSFSTNPEHNSPAIMAHRDQFII